MPYLFSYGSNNKDQLEERLKIKIKEVIPAYYPNHTLAFGSWSKKWDGAVGTVTSLKGENVYGYLTFLTDQELDRLDEYEGVQFGKYERKRIRVVLKDQTRKFAICYVLTPKHYTWLGPPNHRYLEAIHKTQSTHWGNLVRDIEIRNVQTLVLGKKVRKEKKKE